MHCWHSIRGKSGGEWGIPAVASDVPLFDQLRGLVIAGDQGVACAAESLLGYAHKLFLHQHVVGVVRRNGKDWNAVIGEWFDEREQHSSLRRREWPFELETNPVGLGA